MCVPSRSSSSVRGKAVDCAGAMGNTKTSATTGRTSAARPARNPPRATPSTRAMSGYRPHRSADITISIRPDGCSITSSDAPALVEIIRSTGVPSSDVAHTTSRTCSDSKQRARPGSAWTRRRGAGRCQRKDTSAPRSGAANTTSCHRDPISAMASATAAHVAIESASGEARQRNSTSVARESITSRHAFAAPGDAAAIPPPRRRCAPAAPTSRVAG
jgi:hypothetical protein